MTLSKLREKYPKARMYHEADPKCRRCGGSGEEAARVLPSGTRLNDAPCMCVFVSHDMVGEVSAGLARAAKSILRR